MSDMPTGKKLKRYSVKGNILSGEWDDDHIDLVNQVEEELGYAICGARTRGANPGFPCKHQAGWQTEHYGEGRCKFHGGGTKATHGRYSMLRHYDISARAEDFLSNSELMDIRSAVATTWATIDTLLDVDGAITPDRASEIVGAMRSVGNLIKQHHDITQGQKIMIEVPQFMEWAETLYELAIKYILAKDGDVSGFLSEAQNYYSGAVAIVTGDSPPAIGDGDIVEIEGGA